METRTTSPRLGVKEIFFFPFFSHPPAARCNIATTSGYIASLALKEGASNRIAGRETHTLEVYIYIYTSGSRIQTKMFAQPAINNVDGIKCIWRWSQLGRPALQKTISFLDVAKFISPLNRLVYLKGDREIASELKMSVTRCYFSCL